MTAPFQEGDIVSIKDNSHLGFYRVDECEWVTRSKTPYWYVKATEIRQQVDWSKIPRDATGIVVGSGWAGPSTYCELVNRGEHPAGCETCGDDDFSPNVEAFEISGKLLCDECAEEVFEDNGQFGMGA